MTPCDESQADVCIDDVFYRLDTLSEFKVMRRRASLQGVTLVHPLATEGRLTEEHRLMLVAERK